MSCSTYKVSVGIPVFGLGFTSSNQLIIGGGGGAGRSGVKNKLVNISKLCSAHYENNKPQL
jgi:prolactin regulatory element-binding protein